MPTRSHISNNPAVLSAGIRQLFPPGVVAAEMREPGDAALLLPGEAETLGRAVPKRVGEFAAGRLCARRALAEVGIFDFALRVRTDRQPAWPASVVGSISHTAGLCIAAVAEKGRLAAVGVDCEIVGHVSEDIWETICTPAELRWLDSLPAAERIPAVTMIFSAKEAFYKFQYPVTGEWMDFHDLQVESEAWGPKLSAFIVRATRPLAVAAIFAVPDRGRYLFHEEFVTAGIALASR